MEVRCGDGDPVVDAASGTCGRRKETETLSAHMYWLGCFLSPVTQDSVGTMPELDAVPLAPGEAPSWQERRELLPSLRCCGISPGHLRPCGGGAVGLPTPVSAARPWDLNSRCHHLGSKGKDGVKIKSCKSSQRPVSSRSQRHPEEPAPRTENRPSSSLKPGSGRQVQPAGALPCPLPRGAQRRAGPGKTPRTQR